MTVTPPARATGRIGIITGSGPEAGVDLWQKVLGANRQLLGPDFRGDLDAPYVEIVSTPILGLSMDLHTNEEIVGDELARVATELASRVDLYAIACNTLHHYQPELEALELPARLVSVVDVVDTWLADHERDRVALLGARSVMDLGARSPYRHLAVSGTIETADSDAVHELIEAVKTDGAHTPATIDRFGEVLAGLDATHVLLACTELPLIPPPGAGPSLVDVTALLAHELVRSSHS